MRRVSFEQDRFAFPADAYTAQGHPGVAWRVMGWELEPDEETEWSGYEVRTGRALAHMVGDDRPHRFEPADLVQLDELDYCASCGQIGCTHDGRDRAELEEE